MARGYYCPKITQIVSIPLIRTDISHYLFLINAAAATCWCPPLSLSIAVGGHIAATATAIALAVTPAP